jgi:hypothetical protein
MPWEDFSRIFKNVDVCNRTTTRDLKLNVNEDLGAAGVVVGCLSGLARFVLCCDGLRTICMRHLPMPALPMASLPARPSGLPLQRSRSMSSLAHAAMPSAQMVAIGARWRPSRRSATAADA